MKSNLFYLNKHARAWHMARQAADKDLVYVLCNEVWGEQEVIMTQEAYAHFRTHFAGLTSHSATLIDAGGASLISETVLVLSEIQDLFGPKEEKVP